MTEVLKSGRYTYVQESLNSTSKVITHHVFYQKSNAGFFFILITALLLSSTCFFLLEQLGFNFLWSFLGILFILRRMHLNTIEKESVLVLPAFGVQLEAHYKSGRVKRRFVPICKILKPILNECVTPITCYWSLSLLVYGEGEMMLVFQNLRPPVKILVHVWKALCAATDAKEIEADGQL